MDSVAAMRIALVEAAVRDRLRNQERLIVCLPSTGTLRRAHWRYDGWLAGTRVALTNTPIAVTDQRVLFFGWRSGWRGRRGVRVSDGVASLPGSWDRPRLLVKLVDAAARHQVDFVELRTHQPFQQPLNPVEYRDVLVLSVRGQIIEFSCMAERWSDRLAIAVRTLRCDEP
jgi:hypothetical protein